MNKILYVVLFFTTISCGQGFLDVKPSSDTVVPTTLNDFQQLLDAGILKYVPELLDLQADDYYLEEVFWKSLSSNNFVVTNTHVWADDIYETNESEIYGWNTLYEHVFYGNVVLDGLVKVSVDVRNQEYYNHIKGSALFVRAMALHYLVQLYSPAYDPATAGSDLGVPIPLSSDVNEKVKRESLATCMQRITDDLRAAVSLLRDEVDFGRPSKSAAYALLARIYLMMGEYAKAEEASTKSLTLYNDLTDFNLTNRRDYKKTTYMTFIAPGTLIQNFSNNTILAKELFDLYDNNDLRKTVYYNTINPNLTVKKDNYGLSMYCFSGLDTDEQYLIQAECQARLGNKDEAIKTLNYLLKHVHSNYVNKTALTKEEALDLILKERRKQLVFRGLRWSDLKRYNRDGANITLTRKLGNQIYTLPPNSPKWLFPIPSNEIKTSGILQNNR